MVRIFCFPYEVEISFFCSGGIIKATFFAVISFVCKFVLKTMEQDADLVKMYPLKDSIPCIIIANPCRASISDVNNL